MPGTHQSHLACEERQRLHLPAPVGRSGVLRLAREHRSHAGEEPHARSAARTRRALCRFLPRVYRRGWLGLRLYGPISHQEEGAVRLRAAIRLAGVREPPFPRMGSGLRASAGRCEGKLHCKILKRSQPSLEASVREGRVDSSPPLDVLRAKRPGARAEACHCGAVLGPSCAPAATWARPADGSMRAHRKCRGGGTGFTRGAQNAVPARACGFESRPRYHNLRAAVCEP